MLAINHEVTSTMQYGPAIATSIPVPDQVMVADFPLGAFYKIILNIPRSRSF
jgi:hypothetical protein